HNNKVAIHIPEANLRKSLHFFKIINPIIDKRESIMICDGPKQIDLIEKKGTLYNILYNERKIEIIDYKDVGTNVDNIASFSSVITSKLHVGIVATQLGVPVYSIPHHQKTIRYYKQIDYLDNCNPFYDFDEEKHKNILENEKYLKPGTIPSQNL